VEFFAQSFWKLIRSERLSKAHGWNQRDP